MPTAADVPGIRALDEYRAGRTCVRPAPAHRAPHRRQWQRGVDEARDGQPPVGDAGVRSLRLFSETNPVPLMARFDFVVPPPRVEIESRVRLAGTQRVVAIAELGDGSLEADVVSIIVTLAACLDGS